jgi:CRISPR/Cas system-associated exonuclease Cas4 (RecB family)
MLLLGGMVHVVAEWLLKAPVEVGKSDEAWLPDELRGARLAFSEATFEGQGVCQVVARVDRTYELASGLLVLVEFKRRSRGRVFLSDIVELSVQRYAMEMSGYQVSRRAYVVELTGGSSAARRLPVELEEQAQVERRLLRHLNVRRRTERPRGATSAAVCQGCGHQSVCSASLELRTSGFRS